jgi:mono/diheme cytochrome c family protein
MNKFAFAVRPPQGSVPFVLALFLNFPLLAQAQVATGPERPPWQAMDYGPYLTASIEAPEPRTNIAYKGIAINLGANFGGDHNEAVIFDTDLLRYSAGWTGDFVALKGVVFDGEHWAYPHINGDQVFGNHPAPGWAKQGSFADPRQYHFGPLPHDWAHWKGLYLHEKKVLLSYAVGSMTVLEMPALERHQDITAFTRTLNLGPSDVENQVQLVFDPTSTPELFSLRELKPIPANRPAIESLVVLHQASGSELFALAVIGADQEARWVMPGDGNVRLLLPPNAQRNRCKLLLWKGANALLRQFAATVSSSAPPLDLESYTKGGPPRWQEKLVTHGQLGTNEGAYTIDTLTEPDHNPWHSWMRLGGIDFFPDGKRVAVCTWNGDVWIVSGVDGDLKNLTWQRIATGLFQPLGLQIVDGEIYVLGRDQITRLHDLNGDGEADYYENFNNDCMTSEHFHEFALDLKFAPDGNFYYIKCACHGLPASHPHHGTLLRVSRDGSKLEVVARGFRAANGLGVGPHGEFTCIDNQGYWMPGNRINWIQPGGWYGNQWAWNPEGRTNYDEPLCWMHNFVDRSGGTQLWVPNDQWGPFQNQIVTISYGMGHMFLLLKESVDGMMQGAVTRFPFEFETGAMRGVFHPQTGQLYTCGLYGWAGNKTKLGGFYRVRYTGQPARMADELHFVRDGIVLGFTDPLNPDSATDPGNYDVKAWNYQWTANYGSPDFKLNGQEGRDTWAVTAATLSADHKKVFLKVPEVQRVMQLHVVFNLKTEDGADLQNFVHGTIHKLSSKSGADWLGPGAIARAEGIQTTLAREAPGLVQKLTRDEDSTAQDIRVTRLPALFVPVKGSPSPLLDPGQFRSRWEGFLKLDLNDTMVFESEGRGSATLKIEGQVVLDASGPELNGARSRSVALRSGLNRFELDYASPQEGTAEFRLNWSSKHVFKEPIPSTVLVHDADHRGLALSLAMREGRTLFAERRCARCHKPDSDWNPTAMPELAADAPDFTGIGSRLKEDWIEKWLLDPKVIRPDTVMPRLLSGSNAAKDARDIASFLAGLQVQGENRAIASAPSEDLHLRGKELFNDLGCAGCHRLPNDMGLTNESRLFVGDIEAKWQPEALRSFLRNPSKHFRWTRMPDFKLTDKEADALAAFLVSQHAQPVTRVSSSAGQPDAERGKELVSSLGCLGCHSLQGLTNRAVGPSLAQLTKATWDRGCLAENASDRGNAPGFSFTQRERASLRAFGQTDFSAMLRRDTADEFAERQIAALRCQACHARDNKTDLLTELAAATPQPARAGSDDEIGARSVHVGRPSLTLAGEKLYAGWMRRFLDGTLAYKPRPELQGRMPAFPAYAIGLAEGIARQHGYDAESAPAPVVDSQLAEIGRQLTGVANGFSCVSCHNVGNQKALAGKDTATVNFACITDRLRQAYYWRYVQDPPHLLPGTMMPKFIGEDGTTQVKTVFDGDPQRQFTAIWNYLLSFQATRVNAGP